MRIDLKKAEVFIRDLPRMIEGDLGESPLGTIELVEFDGEEPNRWAVHVEPYVLDELDGAPPGASEAVVIWLGSELPEWIEGCVIK